MSRQFIWILLILWLFMIWMTINMNARRQQVEVGSPVVLLEQARKLEAAAGDDQKKLLAVADKYVEISKRFPKTKYAAEALLRLGILQETKLKQKTGGIWAWFGFTKPGYKLQRENAIQTYKNLIKKYPPEKYEASKEAEVRLAIVRRELDKQNSSSVLYKFLDSLVKLTGANPKYSYAFALLVITVLFKVATLPFTHLQYKYMKEMQRIQPLVKQLQEKYKDNQRELGIKIMELYKEHGVNPFGGCLPILIQLPILSFLYWMVRLYEYQFNKGQFLWIGSSLSHKLPSFMATSLAHPDIPLLLLYVVSMFISQKLTVVDPTQAEQQRIMTYTMPIMLGILFWWWAFPSAFMLYWLFFNIISTIQQYYVLKQPISPSGPSATAEGKEQVSEQQPRRVPTSPGKARRRKKKFSVFENFRLAISFFPSAS
jgi:YidC/Oxa1 family membrane protein insertase